MNMFKIAVIITIAFVVQIAINMIQIKHFTKEYTEMRRIGKVAVGKKGGKINAGAIVMFGVDENGIIHSAKKLVGITFLARVKPLDGFEGKFVGDLTGNEIQTNHRNLRKAIRNAAENYNSFMENQRQDEMEMQIQI